MTLSLFQASAPVFIQGLTGLAAALDKASAYVSEKSIDPQALLQARLYPDMFPFARQVQIATDFAKGAVARLATQQPIPKPRLLLQPHNRARRSVLLIPAFPAHIARADTVIHRPPMPRPLPQ